METGSATSWGRSSSSYEGAHTRDDPSLDEGIRRHRQWEYPHPYPPLRKAPWTCPKRPSTTSCESAPPDRRPGPRHPADARRRSRMPRRRHPDLRRQQGPRPDRLQTRRLRSHLLPQRPRTSRPGGLRHRRRPENVHEARLTHAAARRMAKPAFTAGLTSLTSLSPRGRMSTGRRPRRGAVPQAQRSG